MKMNKYRVQLRVEVEIAVEVQAVSLEAAMEVAKDRAQTEPVAAGLIRLPAKVEYLWNNDTKVTGVMDA